MNTYEIETKTTTLHVEAMDMAIENGSLVLFNREGEKNILLAVFKEWNHIIKKSN